MPDLRIQVMHNGNSLSVSPDGFYNLPEGEYTWVIKAKGYGKQTGTVHLKKDETVKVTLSESNAWDGESKEEVTPNAQGIYEIGTGAELAWFAEQVNAGTGKNYDAVLTDDIDLGEYPFMPIGATIKYSTKPYAGIFDGKDHTISGVNIESDGNYVGLFGALQGTSSKYAEVKNLTVKGTVKSDGSFLGGIAGNAKYAKIVNCHNYTDVTASGSKKEKDWWCCRSDWRL